MKPFTAFLTMVLSLVCYADEEFCDRQLKVQDFGFSIDYFSKDKTTALHKVLQQAAVFAAQRFEVPQGILVRPGPTSLSSYRVIDLEGIYVPDPNDTRRKEQLKGAMIKHEFAHILFRTYFEKVNPDLDQRVANEGIRTYSYMYHVPYEEIFADAFVVLELNDPQAMYSAIKNKYEVLEEDEDPTAATRSFLHKVPIESLEKMRRIEHVVFNHSRVDFWARVEPLASEKRLDALVALADALIHEIKVNHLAGNSFETIPLETLNARLSQRFNETVTSPGRKK